MFVTSSVIWHHGLNCLVRRSMKQLLLPSPQSCRSMKPFVSTFAARIVQIKMLLRGRGYLKLALSWLRRNGLEAGQIAPGRCDEF